MTIGIEETVAEPQNEIMLLGCGWEALSHW